MLSAKCQAAEAKEVVYASGVVAVDSGRYIEYRINN